MTIHLRGIWFAPRHKRSDVRVSENNQARVLADLTSTKLEKETDAKLPKHFRARQEYLQRGGE